MAGKHEMQVRLGPQSGWFYSPWDTEKFTLPENCCKIYIDRMRFLIERSFPLVHVQHIHM